MTTKSFIRKAERNGRRGFVRDAAGHFANLSAPDRPGGTRPSANNSWREVTSWYIDTNGVHHGFVWQP
jgi:hypothetical protein